MSDSALGSLLTSAPPVMSNERLADLALRHFGIDGRKRWLTSERDLNVQITTSTQSFVLKLANPAEPPEVTDFQTKALLHLEGSGLPVPLVVRTLSGETEVRLPDGTLRLLTYLEGTPQHLVPRSPAQARAVAAMAARITLGLQGFSHPAAGHLLQWDIKNAADLRPLIPAIADPMLRALGTQTLIRFNATVVPRLPDLRWQVVHNDFNPYNVLTTPGKPDEIAGVLDFGDMVFTPLICDAAIAASYQLDPAKPMESLLNFSRAFHQVLPLTRLEADLIPILVATRMLTTLAITSTRAARYPDNATYIMRNFPAARDGLIALAGLDPETTSRAMEAL